MKPKYLFTLFINFLNNTNIDNSSNGIFSMKTCKLHKQQKKYKRGLYKILFRINLEQNSSFYKLVPIKNTPFTLFKKKKSLILCLLFAAVLTYCTY